MGAKQSRKGREERPLTTFDRTATLPPSFKHSASEASPRKPNLSRRETFTKKLRKFRPKLPNLNGLKKKDKKSKEPTEEDEVLAHIEDGGKGAAILGIQKTRRNSCPNAKEMAEVVEVVVDLVVEAQKKARSRPTSRLIPIETTADGGGQTSRPLSLQAVTDEAVPASVLINTQMHDSRTPRRTSSWVVLGETEAEKEESDDPPIETNEEAVSANQAVIEATKSFVSSLFPWAVDMVLKNEKIKEKPEDTSTNKKEDVLVEEGLADKNEESLENDEFEEALGEFKEIKTHPSFSDDRRPSLLESLWPWSVGSPNQDYATPMESPEPVEDKTIDEEAKIKTERKVDTAENTQGAATDRRPSLFDAIWPWATKEEEQVPNQHEISELKETLGSEEEITNAEVETSVADKIMMFEHQNTIADSSEKAAEEKMIFVKEIERIKSLKENNSVKEAEEASEAGRTAEVGEEERKAAEDAEQAIWEAFDKEAEEAERAKREAEAAESQRKAEEWVEQIRKEAEIKAAEEAQNAEKEAEAAEAKRKAEEEAEQATKKAKREEVVAEAQRKAEAAEAKRKAEAAKAQRKAEEEAEQARKEAERREDAAEAQRKADAVEAQRKAEAVEAKRKVEEEAEQARKEAERKEEAAEAQRKAEAAEAQRKVEEEAEQARKKAEREEKAAEAQRRAEAAEGKRKADEEAEQARKEAKKEGRSC